MAEKKKKEKPFINKLLTIVACVAMVAGIGYFVWEISKEVGTTFTLLTDISEAKRELAELEEEEKLLTQKKELLMDDNYVKVWARGEFLLTKQGEELYRLPAVEN